MFKNDPEEPVTTEVRVCAVDPRDGDQASLCELTTLGLRGCLLRHRDPALVGVSHTVQAEPSLLHCSGIDELSNDGTFRFRPTSCGQRQKHSNDPPPPRMCQFFFATFCGALSAQRSLAAGRFNYQLSYWERSHCFQAGTAGTGSRIDVRCSIVMNSPESRGRGTY